MKYCVQCGSEYRDDIRECADCGSTELAPAQEMRGRGKRPAPPVDRQRFVVAGTTQDPLSAERESQLLQAAGIPSFVRAQHAGTIDSLTSPLAPWWEILTPEQSAARAAELIRQDRAQLEANAEEATRAAEEEEAEEERAAEKS